MRSLATDRMISNYWFKINHKARTIISMPILYVLFFLMMLAELIYRLAMGAAYMLKNAWKGNLKTYKMDTYMCYRHRE